MAIEAPHVFRPGSLYRVKQSFRSDLNTTFEAGEILVFERDEWSRYDSAFTYTFRSKMDGRIKQWWILDEPENADTWTQFFEVVLEEVRPAS